MTLVGGMRPTDLPKELRSCWLLLWGRPSLRWKVFSLPLLLRSLSEFKCCKGNIDKRRFHSGHWKQLWGWELCLIGPTSVMAVRLVAKHCPSDNSAYFPSKDASFSLSCRHQGSANSTQSSQHQHAATGATFWSMTSKLFFSLWKFSLSCWACKAVWEDCFFSVASLSWDNNNRTRTMLIHDSNVNVRGKIVDSSFIVALFLHAACGFHDIKEARKCSKINLGIIQLCTWIFLHTCMTDISVLYLACDSKALILSDLLQHLLILTLLSFCLIGVSFQLLKPQILPTCTLLLSLLIKEAHAQTRLSCDDEQLRLEHPHMYQVQKQQQLQQQQQHKTPHGSYLGPFLKAKIQNPRSEKRRWRRIIEIGKLVELIAGLCLSADNVHSPHWHLWPLCIAQMKKDREDLSTWEFSL